jgi:hypothetical protein
MKNRLTTASVRIALFTIVQLIVIGLLLPSCGDNAVKPSIAGPISYSGDSLYITVVDESGNPMPNSNIYFTCWNRTQSNDCRASIFVNSSPRKPDTAKSLICYPNPVINTAFLSVNNNRESMGTIDIYDYTRSKKLVSLYREFRVGMLTFELDFIALGSMLMNSHPQSLSANHIYWARVMADADSIQHWCKVFFWDNTGLMYHTNSRGYVGIAYSSLPFGEEINRVLEDGTKYGSITPQGDYLYVKCKAPGYKDEYAMINAYSRSERELRITMKK